MKSQGTSFPETVFATVFLLVILQNWMKFGTFACILI